MNMSSVSENDDATEVLLKKTMIEAKYAYIKHIMPKAIKEFSDRLTSLNKFYRKGMPPIMYCSDSSDCSESCKVNNLTEIEEKELKIIYHKLCRIYHPDKNNGSDGDMIRKINELYKDKNLVGLKQILEQKDDVVDVIYLAELEKEVEYCESVIAYQWKTTKCTLMKSYYESQFLTKEEKEMEEKLEIEKLMKENMDLQLANQKLKELIEKTNK